MTEQQLAQALAQLVGTFIGIWLAYRSVSRKEWWWDRNYREHQARRGHERH